VQGPMEVKVKGRKATVYVEETEVPALIGKGGRTVQMLENKTGIGLDIKPLPDKPSRRERNGNARRDDDEYGAEMAAARQAALDQDEAGGVRVKASGSNIFVLLRQFQAGELYVVRAGDAVIGEATASGKGQLRFKRTTPEGQALYEAFQHNVPVTADRA